MDVAYRANACATEKKALALGPLSFCLPVPWLHQDDTNQE
jgi:hypothetical protein